WIPARIAASPRIWPGAQIRTLAWESSTANRLRRLLLSRPVFDCSWQSLRILGRARTDYAERSCLRRNILAWRGHPDREGSSGESVGEPLRAWPATRREEPTNRNTAIKWLGPLKRRK